MKTLIAANWKMNPGTYAEAVSLVKSVRVPRSENLEVVFLPPAVFLKPLSEVFPHHLWGVQNVYFESAGAFTGEISAEMARDAGASYVLVGHSDRRLKFGETDEVVAKKAAAALEKGFRVVLAVGETERGGEANVIESLKKSTEGVLSQDLERLTIAYEPVWAISTTPGAEADTPEHAASVIGKLKEALDLRYIYGGSVTSENAGDFLHVPNIAGALVGRVSLDAGEFSKILKIVAK